MFKRIIALVTALIAVLAFAGCISAGGDITTTAVPEGLFDKTTSADNATTEFAQGETSADGETSAESGTTVLATGTPRVKVTMENGEFFVIELYPEYAPITVTNFLKLVNEGFYNGLTFHRIVDGFMAQGGDPQGTGSGGSDPIFGEFSNNGFTQNTLKHKRGTVSMARRLGNNDSGSCQFFICYSRQSSLDGDYAAFGEVIDGMDVVESFLDVDLTLGSDGAMSSPVTPIVMKTVEQLEQ